MLLPALLLLAAAQPAPPPTPTAGRANLAGLISMDDYPAEALRRGEQGTVRVEISVDAAGHASGCRVAMSSGSALLDDTTCSLLTARARFKPARDARGRPVPDVYRQAITWRITQMPDNAELDRATHAWIACLTDAARKARPVSRPVEATADRAFAACAALERDVLAAAAKVPGSGPATSAEARAAMRGTLLEKIGEMR